MRLKVTFPSRLAENTSFPLAVLGKKQPSKEDYVYTRAFFLVQYLIVLRLVSYNTGGRGRTSCINPPVGTRHYIFAHFYVTNKPYYCTFLFILINKLELKIHDDVFVSSNIMSGIRRRVSWFLLYCYNTG